MQQKIKNSTKIDTVLFVVLLFIFWYNIIYHYLILFNI